MLERAGSRISPQPDGCWIWTGGMSGEYGIIRVGNRPTPVHRWVYETLGGTIPAAHVLHHECEVKACVNPEHLTPMTTADHLAHHRHLAA